MIIIGNFVKNPSSTIYMVSTKKSFPNSFIYRDSIDRYVVVDLKKNLFLKALKASTHGLQLINSIYNYLSFSKNPEDAFKKFKTLCDVYVFNYSQLHSYLIKKGWTEDSFIKIIGHGPEGSEKKPDFLFGDARVFIPDGMQQSRVKLVLLALNTAKRLLNSKGFGYLLTQGTINILNISRSNVIGSYIVGTGEFQLTSSSEHLKEAAPTICHELAHKLEDKYLTDQQKKYISDIYNTQISLSGKASIDKKKLKHGLKLIYQGEDNTQPKNWLLVFTGNDVPVKVRNKWIVMPLIDGMPDSKKADFLNSQNAYKFGLGTAQKDSKWFVTQYARTNVHEFFAELFQYWIAGKTEKIQTEWMNRLLKPNMK